jgi:translation initiation factor IF-2
VGSAYGKIRRMTNEYRSVLKLAEPSTPVSVIGLSEVPNAGDHFMAFPNEKQAREIAEKRRLAKQENERQGSAALSLDDLYNRIHEGEVQDINIIVKADNTGSAEAIKASIEKLTNEQVRINVIHSSAGAITESDVLLASASKAIIYGFNVRPDALVRSKAEAAKVEIRLHRIIYALIEELEAAMKGMLKAVMVEQVTGQCEVRQLISISKIGTIAGCYVTEGFIKKESSIRLLREGVIIYEGKMGSLKRFKDDVKEVKEGYECGITIENYNDIHLQDIVEAYEMVEKK